MSNFLVRAISGLVYAAIFIFAIVFSSETYIALITLFGSISLWEFTRIINTKGSWVFIGVFITTILLNYFDVLSFEKVIYLLVVCSLHSVYLIIDLYSKNFVGYRQITKFFIIINYIILSFFFLAFLPFIDGEYQPELIIYVILIIWANDSFAYIIGKNIGKRKLFERISPKKTIEGFIGGLLFSIITGLIIGFYSNFFSVFNWIIIAIITSILGTYGDLIESKFKRQANVKDSGTIMPGHGGLLDRLDSLFFLAPFVYLYVHYLM